MASTGDMYCEFCGTSPTCGVCGKGTDETKCYECGKNPPHYAGYCKECMDEANSVEVASNVE